MRNKLLHPYWWCQLVGWGLVVVYWLQFPQDDQSFPVFLLSLLLQAGWQIVVTDQYRRLAHRREWLQLPVAKLVLVIFLAWIVLVAQYMLMAYLNFRLRFDFAFAQDIWLGALAGGIRYHAIWLLLFHGYHLARKEPKQALSPPVSDRLFLPNEQGGQYVALADLQLVRVYGHYLRIYHSGGNHLLKEPLRELEKRLPAADFFRTNRSEIIRVAAVREVTNLSRGRYQLTLDNGEVSTISETRAREWRKLRP